jgi:hypothetical protein
LKPLGTCRLPVNSAFDARFPEWRTPETQAVSTLFQAKWLKLEQHTVKFKNVLINECVAAGRWARRAVCSGSRELTPMIARAARSWIWVEILDQVQLRTHRDTGCDAMSCNQVNVLVQLENKQYAVFRQKK